jgi:hypothetical protein
VGGTQAALYYRYIGVFWRLGAGSLTPFDRQRLALDTTDECFGVGFRQALTRAYGTAPGPSASA